MKNDRYTLQNVKMPSVDMQARHIRSFAEEIEKTQKEFDDYLDNITEVLSDSMMSLLLTRDKIGEHLLPDIKGWSWYDTCFKIMEIIGSNHESSKEFRNRLTCLTWRILEELRVGDDLIEIKAVANNDGIIIIAHWAMGENGFYTCRAHDTESCEWSDWDDDDIGYIPREPYILYYQNLVF
jgi:hypothetical protein